MTRPVLMTLLCLTGWSSPAFAQDITFEKAHYSSPTMKTEPEVSLKITDAEMDISGKKPKEFGSLTIPFASIDAMTYEFAQRHRIKEGNNTNAVSVLAIGAPFDLPLLVIGLGVMATKTKSHWLNIQYHDAAGAHTAVLQLDKSEYKSVLETLKTRTGQQIPETNAKTSNVNPNAESKDLDEIVPYPLDAAIAAIKPAMEDFGCKVTAEEPDKIECKRPRGGSELNGAGGEKVTATFQRIVDKTEVHIETDKGFNGRMMKKNWSTPIYKGMIGKLEHPDNPTAQ